MSGVAGLEQLRHLRTVVAETFGRPGRATLLGRVHVPHVAWVRIPTLRYLGTYCSSRAG